MKSLPARAALIMAARPAVAAPAINDATAADKSFDVDLAPGGAHDDPQAGHSGELLSIPSRDEGPIVRGRPGPRPAGPYSVRFTEAVTERPGRSRSTPVWSGSRRIRTGTRCTILVKLPVPGSNGSSEKVEPEPGAKLSI
jgi:hypothetical protein